MFENVKRYFDENVLREYLEYVQQRKINKIGFSKDLRKGLISAQSLYHFREHLPVGLDITFKKLTQICPNYSLLANIVNVSKHSTIDRGSPQINEARNIREEIFNTTYKDKKGEFQHIQKEVIVKLDSGKEIILYELLTEVINMWLNLLKEKGVLKKIPQYNYKPSRLPRRNKKSGVLDIDTSPMFYGTTTRMLRYNYNTRKVEPMDLTGAEFFFKAYAHPVILTLTHPKIKEPISIELILDDKQFKRIESLDKRKAMFELLKIADSKGLIELSKKSTK